MNLDEAYNAVLSKIKENEEERKAFRRYKLPGFKIVTETNYNLYDPGGNVIIRLEDLSLSNFNF